MVHLRIPNAYFAKFAILQVLTAHFASKLLIAFKSLKILLADLVKAYLGRPQSVAKNQNPNQRHFGIWPKILNFRETGPDFLKGDGRAES